MEEETKKVGKQSEVGVKKLVMQREVKFRGISKEKINGLGVEIGDFVYGYYFKEPSGKEYIITILEGNNYDIEVTNCSEFTGLKDKNGKDIYGKDVLTWKLNGMQREYLIIRVPAK